MPVTFPAGGAFTIDGVASSTWNMFIRNPGLQHQPSGRMNPDDIPGRVGRYPSTMELSSRLMSLDIGCYDPLGQAAVIQHISDFAAATDPRNGVHKLVMTDIFPNWWIGIAPSSLGSGQTNIVLTQASLGYAQFTAQYECLDPHWYANTPKSIAWAVPSGSQPVSARQKVVTNVGNTSTPPKITIAYPGASNIGALTGMKITFASTYFSNTWTYNGSMTVGDSTVVDMDAMTILKNGVNDIANWGGDDFPSIPGTATGLPAFTPPVASPVSCTLTWQDTNNVGASITVAYTERQI